MHGRHLCPACGYDLSAVPDCDANKAVRCPECGTRSDRGDLDAAVYLPSRFRVLALASGPHALAAGALAVLSAFDVTRFIAGGVFLMCFYLPVVLIALLAVAPPVLVMKGLPRRSDGRAPRDLRRAALLGLIFNLLLLGGAVIPLVYTCVRGFRDDMSV